MGKIDFNDNPFIPRIDDILQGEGENNEGTEKTYDSDYSVRLATLEAMGGDVTKHYDSVYDIDLEILKLTEEGGGSAIADVDELPDAEENKNKLVRLTHDEKIYVAEAFITTHEEIAPDSEQVGNAYLDDGDAYYYEGECTIIYGNERITGYKWGDIPYISAVNAVNINQNSIMYYPSEDDFIEISETEYEVPEGNTLTEDTVNGYGMTISGIAKQTVTETTWDWKQLSTSLIQPITYAQLKSLRDNKQLVPGQQYRITDYVTTTAQENTQSAGHQFDIIVVADSEDKLNENARAIQHSGDTYFANSKLESWQLKYCLDNDTDRFGWAQGESTESLKVWRENYSEYLEEGTIYTYDENTSVDDFYYADTFKQNYPGYVYVFFSADAAYYSTVVSKSKHILEGDIVVYCESNGDSTSTGTAKDITYQEGTAGKGVIYYMKDEWNNQVYFDFKNIKIYESGEYGYGDYCYLFGDDDDIGAHFADASLNGASNNNIIEGKYQRDADDNEILILDTTTFLFNKVDYDSRNPLITGSATLLSDASMNITGVTNVVFNGYVDNDLSKFEEATVKMNFSVTINGTTMDVTTIGRLTNMNISYQGQTTSAMILLSFNWTEFGSYKLTTLYLGYMDGLGWMANQ